MAEIEGRSAVSGFLDVRPVAELARGLTAVPHLRASKDSSFAIDCTFVSPWVYIYLIVFALMYVYSSHSSRDNMAAN